MEKRKEKLIVRRWRTGNKGIIFLMPETPFDRDGDLCESWDPVGGRCGANYHDFIAKTTSVSDLEASWALVTYYRLYPGAAGTYELAQRATYSDHKRRKSRALQVQHKAEHGT